MRDRLRSVRRRIFAAVACQHSPGRETAAMCGLSPEGKSWLGTRPARGAANPSLASAVTAIVITDHTAIWALVVGWLGWLSRASSVGQATGGASKVRRDFFSSAQISSTMSQFVRLAALGLRRARACEVMPSSAHSSATRLRLGTAGHGNAKIIWASPSD